MKGIESGYLGKWSLANSTAGREVGKGVRLRHGGSLLRGGDPSEMGNATGLAIGSCLAFL